MTVTETASEVVFPIRFLTDPPSGWSVDWEHIDEYTGPVGEISSSSWDPQLPDDQSYMGGILVRQQDPPMVWRLTGETRAHDEFVGRWPD
jgi:hypothetical protein